MKGLILILGLISQFAFAAKIDFKVPEVNQSFFAEDLFIQRAQAEMKCQFIKDGVPTKYSRKLLMTRVELISTTDAGTHHRLKIVAGRLWDFLPFYDIYNCSYKLIVLGKDTQTGTNLVGDIVLLGKERGEMDQEDIDILLDKKKVAKLFMKRIQNMRLYPAYDGKREIKNHDSFFKN